MSAHGTALSKRARLALIAGLSAATLILAAAVCFTLLPGRAQNPVVAQATVVPLEPVPLSTTGATDPDLPGAAGLPGSAGSADQQPNAYNPGTTRTSTEVQGSEVSLTGANPPSSPVAPLLSGAAPKTASATGALVSGFPATIAVAANSTISTSAIASSGAKVQVTLVAHTSRAADDVLAFYQMSFSNRGIPGAAVATVGGSSALSFASAIDTVTVTVTATRNGTNYSIYGVLRATT